MRHVHTKTVYSTSRYYIVFIFALGTATALLTHFTYSSSLYPALCPAIETVTLLYIAYCTAYTVSVVQIHLNVHIHMCIMSTVTAHTVHYTV